jgi:hypothetical protein
VIDWLERALESRRTIWAACACSLALGVFLLLVWSPLPWGWLGIDHYDDRAINLATGRAFDTTDVPWGYAYYLAAFYWPFGHVPVAPLVGQVIANAAMPWLIAAIAWPLVGVRTATLAAVLTGLFSFNTVYASTQSSDAICTVLFAALMLCYLRGRIEDRLTWFVAAGLLGGAVAQFRPNLILFPLVLAAIEGFSPIPAWRRAARAVLLLACTAVMLAPWVVRNYRLTSEFLPTSTHGGVQLWYGTLQVGPYLESRAHNPRSAFESPPFDYSVLVDRPIIVSAKPQCDGAVPLSARLVYWTDRHPLRSEVAAHAANGALTEFEIPGQPAPTAIYYYIDARWPSAPGHAQTTPDAGSANPNIFFISDSHLTDLDRHDDLLDVFDLVRLLRWQAWREPPRAQAALDLTGDQTLDARDIDVAVGYLLEAVGQKSASGAIAGIDTSAEAVTLQLRSGGWFRVPKTFSGKVTDLEADGEFGRKLLYARRSFADLAAAPASNDPCTYFDQIAANAVFYRKEPHAMRRYSALAFDNIRREPLSFVAATIYRALRMFIIRGTDDRNTTQQFAASRLVYTMGTVLSVVYLLAWLTGLLIAWRRRMPVWLLALPIVYVPLTIAPVLTNMRYTLTAQPFVFVFVSIAILTGLKKLRD